MTKSQNYLLHIVSQIPSSESPLNALLTRQNVDVINEQTAQTIQQVKANIAGVNAQISRYSHTQAEKRERATLQETMEISTALKERLASLRTKSQQSSSQYLA
jgi:hypothetical protein